MSPALASATGVDLGHGRVEPREVADVDDGDLGAEFAAWLKPRCGSLR
jgi:hypothetical protein